MVPSTLAPAALLKGNIWERREAAGGTVHGMGCCVEGDGAGGGRREARREFRQVTFRIIFYT